MGLMLILRCCRSEDLCLAPSVKQLGYFGSACSLPKGRSLTAVVVLVGSAPSRAHNFTVVLVATVRAVLYVPLFRQILDATSSCFVHRHGAADTGMLSYAHAGRYQAKHTSFTPCDVVIRLSGIPSVTMTTVDQKIAYILCDLSQAQTLCAMVHSACCPLRAPDVCCHQIAQDDLKDLGFPKGPRIKLLHEVQNLNFPPRA